jgi:general secretion pathway protein C
MAATLTQAQWKIAGSFLLVAMSSWLTGLGVTRVGASALRMPEGAKLEQLTVAPSSETVDPEQGQPNEPNEPSAGQQPIQVKGKKEARYYIDPLVKRSIFDSTKVGVPPSSAQKDSEVTGDERRSDLKVVLLATLVADPEAHSSALIAEEKGSGAMGYGIGDELLGEAKVLRIEPRKVYIQRSDGTVEYLSMDGGTYQKEKPAAGEDSPKGEEEEGDVKKEGPNKFVIDRATVEKVMANPEELYSQIRAVPHKGPNGEVDGYRLSGIRRRSLFNKLGIKNGDIVHSVNGQPLTSMQSAMEAYNSMGSGSNFNFEVTRRNEKQTFEYEIR